MDSEIGLKFRLVVNEINKAKKILLITHKKPDGDALGSITALKQVLNRINKPSLMCCVDLAPLNLQFIPEVLNIRRDFDSQEFDLIITLDCGADYMTGYQDKHPEIFQKNNRIINIDHHPSNNDFGFINIVKTNAASTSFIVFEFLEYARFKIDPSTATSLLTGLYTDTGSFMHSNTTSNVYQVASKLLSRGAKLGPIIKNVFKTTPVSTLKLWGRVLNNLKINSDGITMAVATKDDFKETGSDPEELSGIIDILNTVPDCKFSVLLNEDDKGHVKGSFRTQREDVNLSQVAGLFGGGGHKKAAGFTMIGNLEKEVRWKIVEKK